MRIFLTGLFFYLLIFIPGRWYYVCEIRNNCGPEEVLPPPRATTLSLMDGDSIILEGYEEFLFDSASIQPVLTENNQKFLEAVAGYLKENEDKNLTIIGRIRQSEKNQSSGIFENLGTARATMIEAALEKLGIDEKRITIDHETINGEDLSQPLAFKLYTPESSPDEYSKLQYRFDDMTFSDANFEFGSDVFDPGLACLNYLDSLQIFFTNNDTTNLIITGHTDSIATEKFNYDLGLRRAKNAKQYILDNYEVGIDILTESLGETDPVDANTNPDGTDNEEGRQKNRRVNFKIVDIDVEENNDN